MAGGCSSMAEPQISNLMTGVRFPSPALTRFRVAAIGALIANSRRLSAPRRATKPCLSALARLRRAGRSGHGHAYRRGLSTRVRSSSCGRVRSVRFCSSERRRQLRLGESHAPDTDRDRGGSGRDGDHGLLAAVRSGTGSAVVQRRRVEAHHRHRQVDLPESVLEGVPAGRHVIAGRHLSRCLRDERLQRVRARSDVRRQRLDGDDRPPATTGAPIDRRSDRPRGHRRGAGGNKPLPIRWPVRHIVPVLRRTDRCEAGRDDLRRHLRLAARRPVGGHGSDPTPFWRGDAPPTRGAQP